MLYALGIVLILVGLAGIVLPAIPGGPLIFAGILTVAWAGGFDRIGWPSLLVVGLLALLTTATDIVASLVGAKRYGASWWGLAGAVLGLFCGLPFGLLGVVIGPVVGAVALELIKDRDLARATRVGKGTFFGFVLGTAVKYALALAMLGTALLAWWV